MNYRSLSPDFVIAPQIAASDIPAIKEAGFKTILCTRPDGEDPGQPTAETIGDTAKQEGLSFLSIPVQGGQPPSPDAVIIMQEALNTLPGPVFAYCRSGNRAGQLWALATQG